MIVNPNDRRVEPLPGEVGLVLADSVEEGCAWQPDPARLAFLVQREAVQEQSARQLQRKEASEGVSLHRPPVGGDHRPCWRFSAKGESGAGRSVTIVVHQSLFGAGYCEPCADSFS
jgi:hypothetical protein